MVYAPIIKSLGTLGIVVFLGWISRRRGILTEQDTRALATFIYHFALPALFFVEISRADFSALEKQYLIGSLLPVILILVVLFVLHACRLLSRDLFALLALAISFGSNAFFGVPFFEALYGQWGLDHCILTGAPLSILGIGVSVFIFEYVTERHLGSVFIFRILKSPLVLAIAAGAFFSSLQMRFLFLTDLLQPLGRTAAGMAIFMLGMFVHDHFSLRMFKAALPYAAFRVLVLPVVAFCVLFFLRDLLPQMRQFLLLQSGLPAAISIAIFAQKYRYKETELTGMVVLTSLLSFFVLGFIYAIS